MYQNLTDLVDELVAPPSDSEDENSENTSTAGMSNEHRGRRLRRLQSKCILYKYGLFGHGLNTIRVSFFLMI